MTVARLLKATCLGVGLVALATGSTLAATTPAAPAAPAAAGSTAGPAKAKPKKAKVHKSTVPPNTVEPAAVAAMGHMSAYLKTLTSFEVQMLTERDEVDDYGQLLTFDGTTNYKVKKPDGFRITVTDDASTREYAYDGKSVTVFDPKTKFYAQFAAPPTIRATLDLAHSKYGVDVPLDDLFHWDENNDLASKLTAAHIVGPSTVATQPATHYAFRQAGVDWQIWIATGDKPLPLRVIITASDDPARPQFESTLTWDTAAQFSPDTFVFTPPADAKKIPIQTDAR